jgi:hypothetical protein
MEPGTIRVVVGTFFSSFKSRLASPAPKDFQAVPFMDLPTLGSLTKLTSKQLPAGIEKAKVGQKTLVRVDHVLDHVKLTDARRRALQPYANDSRFLMIADAHKAWPEQMDDGAFMQLVKTGKIRSAWVQRVNEHDNVEQFVRAIPATELPALAGVRELAPPSAPVTTSARRIAARASADRVAPVSNDASTKIRTVRDAAVSPYPEHKRYGRKFATGVVIAGAGAFLIKKKFFSESSPSHSSARHAATPTPLARRVIPQPEQTSESHVPRSAKRSEIASKRTTPRVSTERPRVETPATATAITPPVAPRATTPVEPTPKPRATRVSTPHPKPQPVHRVSTPHPKPQTVHVPATHPKPSTTRSSKPKPTPMSVKAKPVAVRAKQPAEASIRKQILDIANNEVGTEVHVDAAGNYAGRVRSYFMATDLFGKEGRSPANIWEWQGFFTTWVRKQAGHPVGENGGGGIYIDDVINWAKREGQWQPKSYRPKPGDIIAFRTDPSLPRMANFTGVVMAVEGSKIKTVEGNIYFGSDGNKLGVGRRTHNLGDTNIAGFITAVRKGGG